MATNPKKPSAAVAAAKPAAKKVAAVTAVATKEVAPKAPTAKKVVAKKAASAPVAAPVAATPAAKTTKVTQKASTACAPLLSSEQRSHYVSVAAFYIAERRGFTLGDPTEDWLAAEAEVDRLIASGHFPT